MGPMYKKNQIVLPAADDITALMTGIILELDQIVLLMLTLEMFQGSFWYHQQVINILDMLEVKKAAKYQRNYAKKTVSRA